LFFFFFGLADLDCPNFSSPTQTKQHVDILINHNRVDVRNYFCGNRIVKGCNSLTATAEDCLYTKV